MAIVRIDPSAPINSPSFTGASLFDGGTVSLPGIAFSGDTASGIYRIGANNIGVACNGANVLDISPTRCVSQFPLLSGDGSVSLPGYGFASDTDTGLYRIGANNVGLALNGTKYLDFATTALTMTAGMKLAVLDTTNGTSVSSASVALSGGLAVASGKDSWFGGNVYVQGSNGTDRGLQLRNDAGTIISMNIGSTGSSVGVHSFYITTNAGASFVTDSGGNNVFGIIGSALATNATGGFPYISTCAGTPTGVPGAAYTGKVPMIYDTTNNKLYVYNGAWKGVTLA